MGDGYIIMLINRILDYLFFSSGFFDVNIIVYNNVSSKSVFCRVVVLRFVFLVGVEVICNKIVGLFEMIVCYLIV